MEEPIEPQPLSRQQRIEQAELSQSRQQSITQPEPVNRQTKRKVPQEVLDQFNISQPTEPTETTE